MIITQTPLRISLAGGGTDLEEFYKVEDGKVISAAIDKYVFVIVSKRFDEKIVINYSKKEIVDSAGAIQHELVREAMKKCGIEKGIEVTTLADIPSEGSGLGSSSSVTVGLLNAFYIFLGEQVTAERLAREACEIEIEICKKPIGKQDQYIAAYGGICEFTFKKDGSVEVEKIRLNEREYRQLDSELSLFYTNATRDSSDILTEQRANTLNKLEYLKQLKDFVPQVKESIESGNFSAIGRILHESWMLKKLLASQITNRSIDEMYRVAINAGAQGGKISGAGGGGFMLLQVPLAKQDGVRKALTKYRELPFLLEQDGSKVIFNQKRFVAW